MVNFAVPDVKVSDRKPTFPVQLTTSAQSEDEPQAMDESDHEDNAMEGSVGGPRPSSTHSPQNPHTHRVHLHLPIQLASIDSTHLPRISLLR